MATDYAINYEDERFKNVEAEKQNRLNQVNDTYNNMVNQSDEFYQRQIDATRDYAATQQDLQNQQTDLAVNELNQARQKAEKDYIREQKGAYVDWQKQSRENERKLAYMGMGGTGYSESSQVSMYNTYQNRVSTARESYNLAAQNYDNKIAEARLANNAKLAEIAYTALQKELELSLNGFQYKNTLLLDQINKQQDIDNTYYARWQNVLSQMNTENSLAESIREYNEKMAYQRERDKVADAQWQKEFDLAKKAASSSRSYRSSGGGGTSNYDYELENQKKIAAAQTAAQNVASAFSQAIKNTVTPAKTATTNSSKGSSAASHSSGGGRKDNNIKSKLYTAKTKIKLSTKAANVAFSNVSKKSYTSKSALEKDLKGYVINNSDKRKIYSAFGF